MQYNLVMLSMYVLMRKSIRKHFDLIHVCRIRIRNFLFFFFFVFVKESRSQRNVHLIRISSRRHNLNGEANVVCMCHVIVMHIINIFICRDSNPF